MKKPTTLADRLEFLADLLSTRMIVARSADDSARPSFEVNIPTREISAAVSAMREAVVLARERGEAV